MKKNKKSLLRLKKSRISELNLPILILGGDEVGKTDFKSKLRMCLSIINGDICK